MAFPARSHDDGLRQPDGKEPFYLPVGDESRIFEQCHERGLGVMLKGPTGCGKTRFVEQWPATTTSPRAT